MAKVYPRIAQGNLPDGKNQKFTTVFNGIKIEGFYNMNLGDLNSLEISTFYFVLP